MRQRRIETMLLTAAVFFALGGSAGAEWPILGWMEKPSPRGPSAAAKPDERVEFTPLFSFDGERRATAWSEVRQQLREGDLIAFWKNPAEARKEIFLHGKLN